MIEYEDLISRLDAKPRSGGGHEAKCPAHAGAAPNSLIIVPHSRYSPAFLLCCERGCGARHILAAVERQQ